MPLRRFHEKLNWHAWQFWMLVSLVCILTLAGLVVTLALDQRAETAARVRANSHRIMEIKRAELLTCLKGNETRAALRLTFRRLEDNVERRQSPSKRAASRVFFDNTLGPYGHRDQIGPLADRHC